MDESIMQLFDLTAKWNRYYMLTYMCALCKLLNRAFFIPFMWIAYNFSAEVKQCLSEVKPTFSNMF